MPLPVVPAFPFLAITYPGIRKSPRVADPDAGRRMPEAGRRTPDADAGCRKPDAENRTPKSRTTNAEHNERRRSRRNTVSDA